MTQDHFRQSLFAIGLTVPQFAEKTGVTPRSVNRWCSGQQPVPKWATLIIRMIMERNQCRGK